MPGYLLDTNHVSAYFDRAPTFISRLDAAPPEYLFWVSAVSLGEVEASYYIANRDADVIREFKIFLRERFLSGRDENTYVVVIDETTRTYYAEIIGCVWKNWPPSDSKRRTEAHLVRLGVDINDVWIFATASKHNLTLLTTDKMAAITSVVSEVHVENWLL